MPKRIPRWLSRMSRERPLTANLVVFLLVVIPGAIVVNHQQDCSAGFATAWYAAQTPRISAQDEVDAADANVWVKTQAVLTQKATPEDYAALRHAIRQRNHLWSDLVAEKEEHPIPPPPSKFC